MRRGSTWLGLLLVVLVAYSTCNGWSTSFANATSLPKLPNVRTPRVRAQTQLAAAPSQRVAYAAVVQVQVKEGEEEKFLEASLQNARSSKGEPLNQRFDVLQQRDSPSNFALVEIYRNADGPTGHKETPHYQQWRDEVADMMAVPRTAVQYDTVFPGKVSDYHPATLMLQRAQGAADVDVTHVIVKVKPGAEEAFKKATRANALESVKEYGNLRFDVLQSVDDPTNFLLIEVYRTAADAVKHKSTQHYLEWRSVVSFMMAEPREGKKYVTHFPNVPAAWKVAEGVI
ncbi:lsrG [Symbiodinium natans]|uniref:LsrG protein n=1 Tax=Symbiodinium natans TaxID=878477 RepID=A0A812INP3_9DINO|nr:lsrG [Symbiodinium natans]